MAKKVVQRGVSLPSGDKGSVWQATASAVTSPTHQDPIPSSGRTLLSPLTLLALIVLIIVFSTNCFVIVSVHSKNTSDLRSLPPLNMRAYRDITPLEREIWTPDEPIADWVTHDAKPRLLENTFLSNLPMQQWSISSSDFRQKLPATFIDVQTSTNSYFGPVPVYRKPLSRAESMKQYKVLGMATSSNTTVGRRNNDIKAETSIDGVTAGSVTTQRMSRDDFFGILTSPKSDIVNPGTSTGTGSTWVYTTVNINSPALARDIGPSPKAKTPSAASTTSVAAAARTRTRGKDILPYSPLHLTWRELAPRPEGQRVQVWMASEGSVLGLRQEAQDEYVAVVEAYGHTQVFLHAAHYQQVTRTPTHMLPEVYARHLAACPALSSSSFASSSSTSTSTTSAFKTADIATLPHVFEATLRPGDVLYIPAHWGRQMHIHVNTVGAVFGSYGMTQMQYEAGLREVITHAMHEWTEPQRRVVAAVWMHEILSHPNITRGLPHLDALRPSTFYNHTRPARKMTKTHGGVIPSTSMGMDEGKGALTPAEKNMLDILSPPRQLLQPPEDIYFDEDDYEPVMAGVPPPAPARSFYEHSIRPRYGPFLNSGALNLFPGTSEPVIPQGADMNVATISRDYGKDGLRAPAFVWMDMYKACGMRFELTLDNPKKTNHGDLLKGFGILPPEAAIIEKPLDNTDIYTTITRVTSQFAKHFGPMSPEVRSLHLGNLLESIAMWASPSANDASLVAAVLHCMAYSTINL